MNKPLNTNEIAQAEIATRAPAAKAGSRRKTAFLMLGGAIALGAAGFGAYQINVASHHAVTDNAYVDAETAQVTALTS
ncbi:MAG TPA: hypothetical protein VFH92_12935, partial [Phenylobacterium sp.]|nr:hypothetical protein [Phenylobacterium sp.]